MSNIPQIIRNLLYSSANVYTEYLVGLLVSIVIARSLGPEQYGIYAVIVWISSLAITFIISGTNVAAIKFTSELSGSGNLSVLPSLHRHLLQVQHTKSMIVVVMMVTLILAAPSTIVDPGNEILIWLALPAILFKSYHMFQVGIIKGRQEFRELARIAFVVAPLNIVLVAIAYFFQPTVLGYLVAFTVTSLIYLLASSFSIKLLSSALKHLDPVEMGQELIKRVNRVLGYTTIIVVLAHIVFGQSELLFLKHLGNTADLAFFSVAFVLARAASALIPGVYNNILLPRISYAVGESEKAGAATLISAIKHMLFLGLLASVPLAVFAEDIVLFLYGEQYRAAYLPMTIFALLTVFAGVRDTANSYLVSKEQQPLILRIVIVLFIATLALDYFLILEFGLLGAVIAYVIIEIGATVIIAFRAFRLLGSAPDWSKIMRLLLAASLSAAVAYSVSLLLKFTGGFIIGGIVCVVAFILFSILCDALDNNDYTVIHKIVSKRGDPVSRLINMIVERRLPKTS